MVVKPVFRLDEPEALERMDLEELISCLDMQLAPPGATSPAAIVSANFQKNSNRLLVLLPAKGTPRGAWEPRLGGCGSVGPLLRWAEANGFATALLFADVFEAAPAEVFDRVLKGSPARFATVAVANGMLPMLQIALSSMHEVLFSRFRMLCATPGPGSMELLVDLPVELRRHINSAMLRLPPELWVAGTDPRTAYMQLFEVLLEREERIDRKEMTKYKSFQNLKENDMPGLRRLNVDERVARMDRDRGNDELARLCKNNEADEDEEEPGVD